VSISAFDASQSCALSLTANWTLHTPHAASQSGTEHVQQATAGPCPEALAAAMSRALATLADRLAPVLSH
jgi:uncharacterized lipoprotein YmbA